MMSFDEAREHHHAQYKRVWNYLHKCVELGRVAEPELAEINRIEAAFRARLGDEQDPYGDFCRCQDALLRFSRERLGTEEGRMASKAWLQNATFDAPVVEVLDANKVFNESPSRPPNG